MEWQKITKKLEIKYNSTEIDNLYISRITIKNIGNSIIEKHDFANPISIFTHGQFIKDSSNMDISNMNSLYKYFIAFGNDSYCYRYCFNTFIFTLFQTLNNKSSIPSGGHEPPAPYILLVILFSVTHVALYWILFKKKNLLILFLLMTIKAIPSNSIAFKQFFHRIKIFYLETSSSNFSKFSIESNSIIILEYFKLLHAYFLVFDES